MKGAWTGGRSAEHDRDRDVPVPRQHALGRGMEMHRGGVLDRREADVGLVGSGRHRLEVRDRQAVAGRREDELAPQRELAERRRRGHVGQLQRAAARESGPQRPARSRRGCRAHGRRSPCKELGRAVEHAALVGEILEVRPRSPPTASATARAQSRMPRISACSCGESAGLMVCAYGSPGKFVNAVC